MFSLIYGFWKFLFKKDEFFVLIVGLDNAGKSTFLEQVKTKFCPNYKGNFILIFWWLKRERELNLILISLPLYKGMKLSKVTTTVGLNIGKIECSGVTINFLDLGGQQELQPLWDKVCIWDKVAERDSACWVGVKHPVFRIRNGNCWNI